MWHPEWVRRLVSHAVLGVSFSAVVVTAAVVGLSSPAQQDVAVAVPAAVTTIAPDEMIIDTAAIDQQQAADRAARAEAASRSAQRAATAAAKRAATLAKQGNSIKAQQVKIKAAKAKAAAEAKAAKAAAAAEKARAIANRGYLPGTTDPRSMARQILTNKYNYGAEQYDCFNYIIMRESGWRVDAANPSGAYGIPQAKPGSKMASIGSDWRTNPATQIIWGIEYMKARYGSPCEAKVFKAAKGWY